MRKRNPIAYVVVAVGALLAVLLVIASSRRAVDDPVAGAATTAPTSAEVETTPAPVAPRTTPPSTVAPASTTAVTAPKGMASISASALPAEARRTLRLIDDGGPYPYPQDGGVFQNRERILPRKASGYYREYTVETPGSDDRGARRIVAGQAGERYYTDDHYGSFRLVVP